MDLPIGFSDNFWLFGYGSLIWKPPPHFDKRVPGYIEGYVRRFWQASEDHRGTPEAPGRVVTLIDHSHWEMLTDHHSSESSRVWGTAYHIPPQYVEEVRSYLDIREINGYSIQFTPFYSSSKPSTGHESVRQPIHCLVYIGLPNNPQFLGPQEPQALAEHILQSRGPSGENNEYLYMLETALNQLSLDSGDEHVSDLAKRCRFLEQQGFKTGADHEAAKSQGFDNDLRKVGSTEEQEEVEKVL